MGSILEEIGGAPVEAMGAENVARETLGTVEPGGAPVAEVGRKMIDFLKTPTGAGSVESYIDHPMNFDSSKEIAQVLRGVTGLFGNIGLAVVDILIGGMRWMNLRKAGEANGNA